MSYLQQCYLVKVNRMSLRARVMLGVQFGDNYMESQINGFEGVKVIADFPVDIFRELMQSGFEIPLCVEFGYWVGYDDLRCWHVLVHYFYMDRFFEISYRDRQRHLRITQLFSLDPLGPIF